MSNLLKECIADAKAIRDSAIANARATLEESFKSDITKVFANKIREEIEADEQSSVPPANVDDVSTDTDNPTPKPETGVSKNVTVTVKDETGEPLSVNGVPPAETDTNATAETDTELPAADSNEPDINDLPDEDNSDDSEKLNSNELDEILKELATDDDSTFEPVGNKHLSYDEFVANTPDTCDDTGCNTDDITDDITNKDEYDISLDDILKEIDSELTEEESDDSEDEAYGDNVTTEEIAEALVIAHKQNQELKKQLQEYKNTFAQITTSLSETKLLNAKLLYTNKLFKCKNLTESQKLKVINTFDLAKTDREVKLAYTVLAESLNLSGSVVPRKKNTTVSSITEGLASKPVGSTKPSGLIINESNDTKVAHRLQELAGIKVL